MPLPLMRAGHVLPLCGAFLLVSDSFLQAGQMSILVRRYEQAEVFSNKVLQNAERERILDQHKKVQDLADSFARNTGLMMNETGRLASCLDSITELTGETSDEILFPIDTALVKVNLKASTEESIRDEICGIREWYPFAPYEGFLPAELYLRLVLFNTCLKNEMGAQFVVSDAFRPWTLSWFYFMDPDFGSTGLKAPATESNGFINRGSRHNKGEAIDVYFIDVTDRCIEYPGQPCYHRTTDTSTVDGQALYEYVEKHKGSVGLRNLPSERTHFQLASGDKAMGYAAEFPGLCPFGKCRKDLVLDGVLVKKNTLVRILSMNPDHGEIPVSILHGEGFGAVHSVSRQDVSYPYLPVVAEATADICLTGTVVARGTLVEFSGVGDNDSLRLVQLLNDTLTFPARIGEYRGRWHVLPYDSIGVIQGPVEKGDRGCVLRINEANRNWVVSFTQLRRKE